MYTCMLVWVWVGAYLLLKLEKPIFLLEKNQQISFSENCMMKYNIKRILVEISAHHSFDKRQNYAARRARNPLINKGK